MRGTDHHLHQTEDPSSCLLFRTFIELRVERLKVFVGEDITSILLISLLLCLLLSLLLFLLMHSYPPSEYRVVMVAF